MTLSISETEKIHYQNLLGQAPLGAMVINPQGQLIWQNPLAADFMGAEVKPGDIMLPSKDWPQFRDHLMEEKPFYFAIQDQGFVFTPQAIADSEEKRLLLWIVPSVSMNTDLVTMQQDLLHQKKLANLGRMMLEMAHELNNPLAGISMGTQLMGLSIKTLRGLVPVDAPKRDKMLGILEKLEQELEKVRTSTGKAATLRQDLLTYSKPNKLALKPYQISKLLQTVLNSFEHHPIFKQMSIHKDLSSPSATIMCDPLKMEQILYNLIKNAHEATNGTGEVWIREVNAENMVGIEVEDNGPGIPQELMEKVFSPFLTTKPRTGTGLGLSISHQIIQEHGGTFSVYNKASSGACFQIMFPAASQSSG